MKVSWNLKYVRLPPACVGGRRQHAMVYCWQTNRPAEHMALLAACNHSVVTTGSFGWWAAFLAGGTVVYDKSFPRQNSLLSYHYTHADYYPPHWIPL
jgi:galactoside 2-L-fucosyltransferase 1/2